MMGNLLKLAVRKQTTIIRGPDSRDGSRSLYASRQIGGIGLRKGAKSEISGQGHSRWMTEFCNTPRGGKDENVTSNFVLVGDYFYPACVAAVVLRARNRTRKASPWGY